jgi:hypothetical protein
MLMKKNRGKVPVSLSLYNKFRENFVSPKGLIFPSLTSHNIHMYCTVHVPLTPILNNINIWTVLYLIPKFVISHVF